MSIFSKNIFLFTFIIIHLKLFSQNVKNANINYKWENDTSLILMVKGINFSENFLLDLTIYDDSNRLKKIDSIYVTSGIFYFNQFIYTKDDLFEIDHKNINLKVLMKSSMSKKVIFEDRLNITYPIDKESKFDYTDTTLIFKSKKHNYKKTQYFIMEEELNDSSLSHKTHVISLIKDTIIYPWDIFKSNPLVKRNLQIIYNKDTLANLIYEDGFFKKHIQNNDDSIEETIDRKGTLQIKGELYIENHSFKNTTEHAYNSQYPSTIIRSYNQINMFGIPFQLNLSHNTSKGIEPNFRDFFSFNLDINALKEEYIQKIISQENEVLERLNNIDKEINSNNNRIESLKQYKKILTQYPDQEIVISNYLKETNKSINEIEMKDSILNSYYPNENLLDKNDSLSFKDSLNIDKYDNLELRKNINYKNIQQINVLIKKLEKSNELKNTVNISHIEKPNISEYTQFGQNDIYNKVPLTDFKSLLLRFNHLNFGNFYENTGKYSIRDIEMKGISTSFKVDKNNEISLIYGKINNPITFNFDNVNENIKVYSFGVGNNKYNFLSPKLRLSNFKDDNLNKEIPISSNNFLFSANIIGDLNSIFEYEFEYNKSFNELSKNSISTRGNDTEAFNVKAIINPLKFLSLYMEYDMVGANYESEGVFFLNRNILSHAIGAELKIIKNRITLKSELSTINKNPKKQDFKNQTKKIFFDIRSNFVKIPNFQFIHSPITYEIANNLDTSFSNINGLSTVTLARIYYLKKIKKTVINTAIIYNEITNDFILNKDKQQSFQYLFSLSLNNKTTINLTSAYKEIHKKLDFISISINNKLKDNNIQSDFYYTKNFNNNESIDNLRFKISSVIYKNLSVGGGINLFFRKNNKTNIGSILSLTMIY